MASSNYWSDGSGNELGIQTTKKWDWTGNCCYRCRHRFVVVFAVAVFIALPSFGVIVAAVTAVSAIVLVASATIALSAFDITVAVVATTFLAIEAALVFDCCVPLPLEEDHCLPPPSGKVRAWPSSPLFVDCRRRRRTMPPLPRHLPLSSFIVSFLIYSLFPLTYSEELDHQKCIFYLRHNFYDNRTRFSDLASPDLEQLLTKTKQKKYGRHPVWNTDIVMATAPCWRHVYR